MKYTLNKEIIKKEYGTIRNFSKAKGITPQMINRDYFKTGITLEAIENRDLFIFVNEKEKLLIELIRKQELYAKKMNEINRYILQQN